MIQPLACVVMSYQDEPFLPQAVRSVLQQAVPVELVVVNSGGGDPERRLREAGLDVVVHSVAHRLYPGAVRNLGIGLTQASYVSFLAADCMASPGWAEARLHHHLAGAVAVASVMTNAYVDSIPAWAGLLLLHSRRLSITPTHQQLLYSLSYARHLFDHFGYFREDLRAGEDTEFNARIPADHRIVLAIEAITAHRYPTTAEAVLRDAFRRGWLQAANQGAIAHRGPERLRVALGALWNLGRSLLVTARSPSSQRMNLMRALPLVFAGSVVYAVGAIATFRPSGQD